MYLEHALIKVDGSISSENTCRICEHNIQWYAPVEKDYLEKSELVKAELIAEHPSIHSGSEKWADVAIYVVCPCCNVKNKFDLIKYKLR